MRCFAPAICWSLVATAGWAWVWFGALLNTTPGGRTCTRLRFGCRSDAGNGLAAIDTYMSCRSHLVDDLGIDPSSETTRLYTQVLAMED
jgi:DNA-binding SARP family transcriptional activator